LNCRGNRDYKLSAKGGFVCDKPSATAVNSDRSLKDTLGNDLSKLNIFRNIMTRIVMSLNTVLWLH